jgi:hypothetical protein
MVVLPDRTTLVVFSQQSGGLANISVMKSNGIVHSPSLHRWAISCHAPINVSIEQPKPSKSIRMPSSKRG